MEMNENSIRYANYAAIRDKKGLTDAQVAKMAGLTQSTLSDWKAGRYTPAFGNIIKIAKCLKVSANKFEGE